VDLGVGLPLIQVRDGRLSLGRSKGDVLGRTTTICGERQAATAANRCPRGVDLDSPARAGDCGAAPSLEPLTFSSTTPALLPGEITQQPMSEWHRMIDPNLLRVLHALEPADVADLIVYLISRPPHVNISTLDIVPTQQT
jgi:hypothetical protein